MNRGPYCTQCSHGQIKVSNTPVYVPPYQGLSTSQRAKANQFIKHYWNESLEPVTNAQMERANEQVLKKVLPWYVDQGGSIQTASMSNFYK